MTEFLLMLLTAFTGIIAFCAMILTPKIIGFFLLYAETKAHDLESK